MTASLTPRRKRDNRPLRAVIVHQAGAPLREEDWTPEQEERAIQALATVLGLVVESRSTRISVADESSEAA